MDGRMGERDKIQMYAQPIDKGGSADGAASGLLSLAAIFLFLPGKVARESVCLFLLSRFVRYRETGPDSRRDESEV